MSSAARSLPGAGEPPLVVAPPIRPAGVSVRLLVGATAGVAVVVAGARLVGVGRFAAVREFVVIFASIVFEALPFVLAGAVASWLIAVYVPDRLFARVRRAPRALQVPGAIVCALAFPVCECGSVPVARRLVRRGLHPSAGIAFMLAAPVINPIVLGSTWLAYSASGLALKMTVARAAVGVMMAVLASALLPNLLERAGGDGHGHDHDHGGGGLAALTEHVAGDFLFMGKFVALGAASAALLQAAVPQDVIASFGGLPLLAPLALMAMAVLLSLCSEADAFVAVSFAGFSPGAQLAFLALGPIVDLKLAALYSGSFRKGFAPALLALAIPVLVLAATLFDALLP